MILHMTVDKYTVENGKVVVRLSPSLTEPREGDEVSGSIFLSTAEANTVFGIGDGFEVSTEEEVPAV